MPFTPAMLHGLPPEAQLPIVTAYNQALMPIFMWLVPLAILSAVVLIFLKQKPLATSIESIEEQLAAPEDVTAVDIVMHNEQRALDEGLIDEHGTKG